MSILSFNRLTLRQVANRCGVHKTTVTRWAANGVRGRKLRTVLIGGRRFVLEDDLERFLSTEEDSGNLADRHDRVEAAGRLLDGMGITRR